MTENDPIIKCRGVEKWYGHFQALKGVDMDVHKGEVIVVFGPSGSGKSTFIRTLNRLEEHQKGQIVVDGIELTGDMRNIEAIRMETGMVFQQFNLISASDGDGKYHACTDAGAKMVKGKSRGSCPSVIKPSRDSRASPEISRAAFGRAAAEGCHRTSAGYAAKNHAL